MIKQFLIAAGTIAAASVAASAADMPAKTAPAMVRAGCANFSGLYVGAHVGSTTHDWNWQDRNAWARNEVDLALPDSTGARKTGISGGPQAGWNWQRRCTVFGVEADWSWAGVSSSKLHTDGQPGAALDTLVVTSKLNWYGTLRTRAGVVVDDVLIYATGGFIYASINRSWAVTNNIGGVFVTESFADNNVRWGGVVGVGTEWQWNANWSIKSEALYAAFQDRTSTGNSAFAVLNGNPAAKSFTNSDSLWIARLGVNYRWAN